MEDDKRLTSNSKTTNIPIVKVKKGNEPNISNETKMIQQNENMHNMATKDVQPLSCLNVFKKMTLDGCTKEAVSLSKTIPSLVDRNTNQQHSTEFMEDEEQLINSSPNTVNEPQAIESMEIGDDPNIPKEINENVATEEASSSLPAFTKNPLVSWTKDEKFNLYLGIKNFGSKNVEAIQENLRSKTFEEIKEAIAHYKDRANQNPECTSKKMKIRKVKAKPLIPLASWAKVLTDNHQYMELQTEIISSLRLIADLEDIWPALKTGQIDFRKTYHQIADSMEGKLVVDNFLIAEVLHGCILETALLSKKFINVNTFKNIVGAVNFKDKSSSLFPRPTKDFDLSVIRTFASQEPYNPLGVPVDNLLPMSNEPITDPA